jgi:CHAT domain-containing protein
LGEEDTEKHFKDLAAAGRVATYLAFSTHGLIASETNQLCGVLEPALVMSPPMRASPHDDGLLTSSEIERLRLRADFVFLISCNSGIDNRNDSRAFGGLALSFLAAGAKALVTSYFPVDVDATYRLMDKFAGYIRTGISPQASLTKAMTEVRKYERGIEEYTHPRYWAGFEVLSTH